MIGKKLKVFYSSYPKEKLVFFWADNFYYFFLKFMQVEKFLAILINI